MRSIKYEIDSLRCNIYDRMKRQVPYEGDDPVRDFAVAILSDMPSPNVHEAILLCIPANPDRYT